MGALCRFADLAPSEGKHRDAVLSADPSTLAACPLADVASMAEASGGTTAHGGPRTTAGTAGRPQRRSRGKVGCIFVSRKLTGVIFHASLSLTMRMSFVDFPRSGRCRMRWYFDHTCRFRTPPASCFLTSAESQLRASKKVVVLSSHSLPVAVWWSLRSQLGLAERSARAFASHCSSPSPCAFSLLVRLAFVRSLLPFSEEGREDGNSGRTADQRCAGDTRGIGPRTAHI